jgi:hypothetical protein
VIVALIVLAALTVFSAGAATGIAVATRRSRSALNVNIQRDALAVLRDLALTPDVIDRHVLTPGAQSVHSRAHNIITRYDRANRQET